MDSRKRQAKHFSHLAEFINQFRNEVESLRLDVLGLSYPPKFRDFKKVSALGWHQLDGLLKKLTSKAENPPVTKEQLQPLVDLLKERFTDIKDSPIAYCRAPHFPINLIYLKLAEYLEPIFGVSRFQLLMPTLLVTVNELTGTSLTDTNLRLMDFVLSDDKTRFIEIAPCLDSAQPELMHTALFNGEKRALSPSEKTRSH